MRSQVLRHLIGVAGGALLLWGAGFAYILVTAPSSTWQDEGVKAAACVALAGALLHRAFRAVG